MTHADQHLSSLAASPAALHNEIEERLEWEVWDRRDPFWVHAVCGSIAGCTEHVAMFPVDTLKTRLQAIPRPGEGSGVRLSEAFRGVIQERGIRGLFRGAGVIAAGCVPAHVSLFCVYEHLKERLKLDDPQSSEISMSVKAAVCGGLATLSHDVIMTPMDMAKQRMQLGCYRGVLDCFKNIARQEGVGAFFRSIPTTVLINVPYGCIFLAVNERLKRSWGLTDNKETPNATPDSSSFLSISLKYLSAAGISGGIAAAATNPLDVVKTRLQTQNCTAAFPCCTSPKTTTQIDEIVIKYKDLPSTCRLLWAEEGFRGFWRGAVLRTFQGAPSAALCWGTYEILKKLLRPSPPIPT